MDALFAPVTPLQTSLDYHLERHNLLASNIAHVETPGYKPRDLQRVNATFPETFAVALERTSAMHLASPTDGATPSSGRVFRDLSAGRGRDNNYVSLDREAAKVAANHIRYDVVSAVVSAELRQLAYAANDSR